MNETFTADALRAHLDSLASDEGTAARETERAALIARLPELALAQERLAKAVTRAIVADDEVLLGEVKSQYAESKAAAETAQERLAELEGIERDLRARPSSTRARGQAMASWTELLGRAEVELQHLDAARKFLGAVLVGPIRVTPEDYGWSFEGRSRLDGRLLGFLDSGPEPMTVAVRTGRPLPPIAGGSDAPYAAGWVVGGLHGPEWPPIPPNARHAAAEPWRASAPQRSERPGKPVALLDPPTQPSAAPSPTLA